VINLTAGNWENQVMRSRRKKDVWVVHFYKSNDGNSEAFSTEFKKTSENMDGILKFGGISCNENRVQCDKEGVQTFPQVIIYAPMPIPAIKWEGELNAKKIATTATHYVSNLSTEVTDDNMEGFLKENAAMPKVLLFTDKTEGTPLMLKGLSVEFENKLSFGIVRKSQFDVTNKFSVKKFPTIILLKTGDRKPNVYDGKLNYKDLFQFCNVFSEQFVYGGGSSADGAGVAPWLNEAVPEFFSKSSRDVCIGHDQTLCVILFTDSKPKQEVIDVLKDVRRAYDAKGERAVHFKFMWLNVESQSDWKAKFENEHMNEVYVFNPGRRKRYLKHEGVVTYNSLFGTLEKIVGGDGRFNMVKGNIVPEFST